MERKAAPFLFVLLKPERTDVLSEGEAFFLKCSDMFALWRPHVAERGTFLFCGVLLVFMSHFMM